MPEDKDELLPTRASLIGRLKDWNDQSSWQEFFDVYWKLIYGVARQSGLNDAEAQDVVQETLVSVAKHMPNFRYDATTGSFKTWLLNMTRWRIIDQVRRRARLPASAASNNAADSETLLIEKIADPASDTLEKLWEAEWQANLLTAAMSKVKRRADPQKFQIFDLYVNKEWPPEKVAATFKVSVDQVYLAKHRITDMIREEVQRLEQHGG